MVPNPNTGDPIMNSIILGIIAIILIAVLINRAIVAKKEANEKKNRPIKNSKENTEDK